VLTAPAIEPGELGLDQQREPAKAMLLLADRDTAPWPDLVPALERTYPDVPIVGGLLSDGNRPEGVRLLVNGKLQDDGAVGVMIRGSVEVSCFLSQGCRPVGQPWVVTDVEKERLWGLGGRSPIEALEQLAATLSRHEQKLVDAHGLFLGRAVNEYKPRFGRGDFLVREVLKVDEDHGSLGISDPNMAVGQTVQFHVLDPRCVEADLDLLLEAQKLHPQPQGTLMFTCPGRGEALGNPAQQDPQLLERALGPAPLAGFLADAQIGPGNRGNHAHVRAASVMVFREPAQAGSFPQEAAI
jgi:small ligand-binding sensory domain FIST